MLKKLNLIILLLTSAVLFFNCPSAVEEDEQYDIGIDNVGWYIENIDTGYWTGTAPDATCFYDFMIHYSGNFPLSKIDSSTIYALNSTIYWNMRIDSDHIDAENKVIYSPRFYSSSMRHYLPIGNIKATIRLKNGQKVSFDKIIPAPGSKSQDTYNYVYTESYSSIPGSDFTSLIKKAAIGSYSRDSINQTVSIPFSINDNRVCDGWLWFYDSSNNYIGFSSHFIDTATGNLNSSLFTGGTFNTDGILNTFNIADTNITYNTGYNFSNITKFVLILRDGKQYIPDSRYSAYDCRSISAKKTF